MRFHQTFVLRSICGLVFILSPFFATQAFCGDLPTNALLHVVAPDNVDIDIDGAGIHAAELAKKPGSRLYSLRHLPAGEIRRANVLARLRLGADLATASKTVDVRAGQYYEVRFTQADWTKSRLAQRVVGEIVLYTFEKGGHAWPGDPKPFWAVGKPIMELSATDVLWEFFKKHPKQTPQRQEK